MTYHSCVECGSDVFDEATHCPSCNHLQSFSEWEEHLLKKEAD